MQKSVVIDYLPESVSRYRPEWAIVAVDVIRATTTAITAAATGRRCFPVPTIEAALSLAREFEHPLLAGESGGKMPAAFEIDNSPAELAGRADTHRPLVLVSSSGTKVIHEAAGCEAIYLGCYRSYSTLPAYLVERHAARRRHRRRQPRGVPRGRPDLLRMDRRRPDPRRIRRRQPRNPGPGRPLAGRPARGVPGQPERQLPQAHRPHRRPGFYSHPHRRPLRRIHRRAGRGAHDPSANRARPHAGRGQRGGAMNAATPAVMLQSGHHGDLGIVRSLGRLGVPVYSVGRRCLGAGLQFPLLPRPLSLAHRHRAGGAIRGPPARNRSQARRQAAV